VVGPGLKKNPVYDLIHGLPLHMSPDSELSLIDTATIARCLETLIERGGAGEVYNVAAAGSVRVRDLRERLGRPLSLAPGADRIVLRYSINNDKLASLVPLPTAWEALTAFLEGAGIRLADPARDA